MKLSRIAVPVALALGLGLGTFGAATTTANATPSTPATHAAKPKPLLKKPARGTAAIRALGGNLGEAASRSRMTEAKLRSILSTDPSAVIYPSGRLAFVDKFDVSPTNPGPQASSLIVPTGQTFTLHSRPGSKHTIYLDFNGATISGTAWNGDGSDEIPEGTTLDAFSLDGDFSTNFSNTEHEYIQEVWREISEAYATFDVDVTTQDPGDGAWNRSGPTDQTYGDHVLFTDDPASYPVCDYNEGCGGVAFVGTFDDITDNASVYEPEFVHDLGSPFDTAMAAAHEIGHTLGLSHDGRTSPREEYYSGQGVWTPMMGSGDGAVHQFSNGDYKNANNHEDDFAVMQSYGLPKLPDDAGNTFATANTLGAANYPTATPVTGVIGSRSDVDYYKIGPCATQPTLQAKGTGMGSALDLRIDVYNADTSFYAFSDPSAAASSANPNPNLDTGQIGGPTGSIFYVKLDGVGNGSATSNGYSDYGSVGTYNLTVTNCVAANGAVPTAPTGLNLTNTKGNGTVTWNAVAGATGYRVSGVPGTGTFEVPTGTTSKAVTVNGGYDANLSIVAFNANGSSTPATLTKRIGSWAPTTPPTVKISTKVLTATVSWTPGANPGGAVLTGWIVKEGSQQHLLPVPDYQFGVNISYSTYGTHKLLIQPQMYTDDSSVSPSRTVTFSVSGKPGKLSVNGASGRPGGVNTATAKWGTHGTGGSAITSFKVYAYRLNAKGHIVSYRVATVRPALRSYAFKLVAGKYRFRVVAYNKNGGSPVSAYSKVVVSR